MAKTVNSIELEDGRVLARLSVASSELPEGASFGAFLVSTREGKSLAGTTFTILNGSARFSARSEAASVPIKSVPPTSGSFVLGQNSSPLSAPSADGTLSLKFLLTPVWSGECLQLMHRGMIVTLLDHQPIELGELGVHPAFELKQGDAASFDVTLKELPTDDELHALEVWWLEGDGAYVEAPYGEFSPWAAGSPKLLGHVSWGKP
jgi:hypothetical protein